MTVRVDVFREKLKISLPSGWETAVVLAAVFYLLPHTVISRPLEVPLLSFLYILGIVNEVGNPNLSVSGLMYLAGYVLLLCVLLKYLYVRAGWQDFAPSTTRLADAVCLFGGLYLLDFFTSTTDPFPFYYCWWIFFVLAAFFVLVLFFDRPQALRLTQLIVMALGIQALYGVVYYVLDINQFITPGFGNRTGGSFEGFGRTNIFYPLCLMGVPLSLALAEVQASAWRRWMFRAVSGMNLLALLFTYTRSGWLALIAALLYLAYSLHSPLHARRLWRVLILVTVIGLVLGAALVRTKGKVVGHSDDRSFWGRIAIWQVAGRVITHRPWLGSGVSSYKEEQHEHLTPRLIHFNPLNVEPKCLYLNIVAEFGIVGLVLFVLMAWRYVSLYRSTAHSLPPPSEDRAVAVGIHAGVIALSIAGLTDTPILHFDRQPSSFLLAVLVGVLCVLANEAEAQSLSPSQTEKPAAMNRRWWRVGTGITLIIGVVSLWLAVVTVRTVLPQLPEIKRLRTQNPPVPQFVPLSQVSPPMRDATLAMEDYRFYEHKGLDWEALHRALRRNVRALRIKEGGSTITMQLAKNLFLTHQRTLTRKLSEIVLARYMEKHLSKDRILELYLNVIDYGLGARGIGEAARVYFGKQPSELTLAEGALLAGLVPRPPQGTLDAVDAEKARREALRRIRRVFPIYTTEELERADQERLPASLGHEET